MRITFELDAEDLQRFRDSLKRAHALVRCAEEVDIVAAAAHALDTLPIASAPGYVRQRIGQVQRLLAMLEDEAWALPAALRAGVLPTLAYFSDPEDLIPDHLHGVGLIDDAIMLELLLAEQRAVLDAYESFCDFRRSLGAAPPDSAGRVAHARTLAERRAELQRGLSGTTHPQEADRQDAEPPKGARRPA